MHTLTKDSHRYRIRQAISRESSSSNCSKPRTQSSWALFGVEPGSLIFMLYLFMERMERCYGDHTSHFVGVTVQRATAMFSFLINDLAHSLYSRQPRSRTRLSATGSFTKRSALQRCTKCGLTPRSRRGPTASHQARPGGTRYIFANRALASCRWSRLSSNVRHHQHLRGQRASRRRSNFRNANPTGATPWRSSEGSTSKLLSARAHILRLSAPIQWSEAKARSFYR